MFYQLPSKVLTTPISPGKPPPPSYLSLLVLYSTFPSQSFFH